MATPTARMQRLQAVVRSVPCPTCGATAGSSCLTRRDYIAWPPHKARITASEPLEPVTIMSDDGTLWLGEHDAVVAAVRSDEGPDRGFTLAPSGWMHNVGWDRENYERKRDFIAESGYSSWWEGCTPPPDEQETTRVRRAWEVLWTPDA